MTRRCRRRVRAAVAGLTVWAGLIQTPVSAEAELRVYVSAVDEQTGTLITDLRPAEVTVVEDEVLRPVIDIRPANLPLKVVILVDNSNSTRSAFERVRDGVGVLLDSLPNGQEVSILTLAPRPAWVMQGAIDRADIQAGLEDLRTGEGAARLLDGLVEASAWVAEDRFPHRPVFVVVAADGADRSRDLVTQFETMVERTTRLGITVHTVAMQTAVAGSLVRRQSVADIVGRDLAPHTQGSIVSVLLGSDLGEPLGRVGDRIAARNRELSRQLVIRCERPDDAEARVGPLRVTIARFGIRYRISSDGRMP